MTRPPDNLRALLADWLAALPDERLHTLLHAAHEAALSALEREMQAELAPLLRARLVALLAAEQPTPPPAEQPTPPPAEQPAPPLEPALTPDTLAAELTALREQLATNEDELRRLQPPAPEADPPPESATHGWYVYAVVPADTVLPADVPGMVPEHTPTVLAHAGLGAVVSRVPLAAFGQEVIEEHMRDPAWLEVHVLAHQATIDALLPHCAALLPLAFATIYHEAAGVAALLAERAPDLHAALARLHAQHEWGVKAFYAPQQLDAYVTAQSERVHTVQAQASDDTSGAAYMARRRLAGVLADERERCLETLAQESHTALAAHASAAVRNPLHSAEASGRGQPMLLNDAFLVPHAARQHFAACVAQLQEQHRPAGVHYELTGPWAAYNFSTLPEDTHA